MGKSHEHVGHVGIAGWRNETTTQDISGSGIKASRNYSIRYCILMQVGLLTYHEIRVKFLSDRHHNLLKGVHVVAITHTLVRPRDVDISRTKCELRSVQVDDTGDLLSNSSA